MDEFHGLKGGSGSSVSVSIGAHNQPGKEPWYIVSNCKAKITWFVVNAIKYFFNSITKNAVQVYPSTKEIMIKSPLFSKV